MVIGDPHERVVFLQRPIFQYHRCRRRVDRQEGSDHRHRLPGLNFLGVLVRVHFPGHFQSDPGILLVGRRAVVEHFGGEIDRGDLHDFRRPHGCGGFRDGIRDLLEILPGFEPELQGVDIPPGDPSRARSRACRRENFSFAVSFPLLTIPRYPILPVSVLHYSRGSIVSLTVRFPTPATAPVHGSNRPHAGRCPTADPSTSPNSNLKTTPE